MPNRLSAGFSRPGINSANSPVVNLMNTGTALRLYVVEVSVGIAVAPSTAPAFYLSRATARGTQSATHAGQPHDPADAGTPAGTLDTTWSVNPTFSTTNFLQRGSLAVTAGGMLVWTFYDEPIVITNATTAGLVLANANASGATTGTFTGYVSWTE